MKIDLKNKTIEITQTISITEFLALIKEHKLEDCKVIKSCVEEPLYYPMYFNSPMYIPPVTCTPHIEPFITYAT